MRIGEIAKALGVSQATIRRLERRGVIVANRDWAGHRRFTQDDLERARGALFGVRAKDHALREESDAGEGSSRHGW